MNHEQAKTTDSGLSAIGGKSENSQQYNEEQRVDTTDRPDAQAVTSLEMGASIEGTTSGREHDVGEQNVPDVEASPPGSHFSASSSEAGDEDEEDDAGGATEEHFVSTHPVNDTDQDRAEAEHPQPSVEVAKWSSVFDDDDDEDDASWAQAAMASFKRETHAIRKKRSSITDVSAMIRSFLELEIEPFTSPERSAALVERALLQAERRMSAASKSVGSNYDGDAGRRVSAAFQVGEFRQRSQGESSQPEDTLATAPRHHAGSQDHSPTHSGIQIYDDYSWDPIVTPPNTAFDAYGYIHRPKRTFDALGVVVEHNLDDDSQITLKHFGKTYWGSDHYWLLVNGKRQKYNHNHMPVPLHKHFPRPPKRTMGHEDTTVKSSKPEVPLLLASSGLRNVSPATSPKKGAQPPPRTLWPPQRDEDEAETKGPASEQSEPVQPELKEPESEQSKSTESMAKEVRTHAGEHSLASDVAGLMQSGPSEIVDFYERPQSRRGDARPDRIDLAGSNANDEDWLGPRPEDDQDQGTLETAESAQIEEPLVSPELASDVANEDDGQPLPSRSSESAAADHAVSPISPTPSDTSVDSATGLTQKQAEQRHKQYMDNAQLNLECYRAVLKLAVPETTMVAILPDAPVRNWSDVLVAKVHEHRKQRKEAEAKTKASESWQRHLQEANNEAENQLEQWYAKATAAEEEVQTLKSRLDAVAGQLFQFGNTFRETNDAYEQATEDNARLQAIIVSANTELEKLRERHNETELAAVETKHAETQTEQSGVEQSIQTETLSPRSSLDITGSGPGQTYMSETAMSLMNGADTSQPSGEMIEGQQNLAELQTVGPTKNFRSSSEEGYRCRSELEEEEDEMTKARKGAPATPAAVAQKVDSIAELEAIETKHILMLAAAKSHIDKLEAQLTMANTRSSIPQSRAASDNEASAQPTPPPLSGGLPQPTSTPRAHHQNPVWSNFKLRSKQSTAYERTKERLKQDRERDVQLRAHERELRRSAYVAVSGSNASVVTTTTRGQRMGVLGKFVKV
ncbi:hypothetical protein LTR62_005916 [Meristemomyces frigidus]|uniref:Uncharacterized protein n=1 Tax=Meristemomyces frigidus TaxID=1508187 RepID=A0AAN7TQN6_9PEZI|nr:hypothetical protein LTR62_005916 [Meristemomyces frigidus]